MEPITQRTARFETKLAEGHVTVSKITYDQRAAFGEMIAERQKKDDGKGLVSDLWKEVKPLIKEIDLKLADGTELKTAEDLEIDGHEIITELWQFVARGCKYEDAEGKSEPKQG